MALQRRWQRLTLLTILAYEGVGCLLGGALLAAKPDGRYMDLPVGLMHGTFRDFLIPGLILFALGVLNCLAFVGVVRRSVLDWVGAGLAIGGLAIWFLVEIAIIRELHWLHIMWGFPVILAGAVAIPLLPLRPAGLRDAWLIGGILSSILYAAMNIVVAAQWPAYSSAGQTVSELSAVGAPTRPLWVVLAVFYTVLVTGFGWGVRMAAADNRRLRLAGLLIALYGALGIVWPFAPMHLRKDLVMGAGNFSDTLHIALGVVTEVIYIAALLLAAGALTRTFRIYSFATLVALFGFAVLTFRDAPSIAVNRPTPLIGVWERINIGVFLLWVIVLATSLLVRAHARDDRRVAQPRSTRGPFVPRAV